MKISTEVIPPSVVAADEVRANILIVDDRPDKLLVFKTILEDLEQNIITLQSGEEALRWLLENECAVMLLDVNMPGMDGFETANLIRGRRRSAHTPIIFITAHSDEMYMAKGYSLGAVDYLLTPAAPNVLRSKVMVFVQLFNLTQQIKRQADEHVNLAREQAARAAAEELTRRASFLAEASKILISSLDVNSLMVGATRLVVPMLADFSAITLIDGEETLVRTASGHGGNLDALGNAVIQHPLWVAGANEVLATGRPKIIENFSGRDGAWVRDESAEEGKPPSGHWSIKHVAMLPLMARDKTYGVLAFALGPSGRRFSNLEIELASDITSRVAVALDNCLLFKEIQKADQRKNEFLATLSHELRNPLAPMRTAIHALHLSGLWPAGAQEMREMLERQLAHLTHLVDDLLDVARITQGKIHLRKERANLVKKVKDALETCRPSLEQAGHKLVVNVPPEPLVMVGDRVRLQQIFENLIINAAKYTEPGGRIEVNLERVKQYAVLRVRDNGVGISPDAMSRIWDMFSQVDESADRTRQGLGIGLSLVRKLVQLHGGEIQAFSEGLGKGSEFVVRMPLESTAPPPQATLSTSANAEVEEPPFTMRRILVVDDNTDAAESLQMLLGVLGHTVEIAFDGLAALQVVQKFKPELVFLDIGMPGMNGYEVARRIREVAGMRDVKLIALSGYGTDSDQMRSKEAGFDRHLVKPVDPHGLPQVIANAFPT